jgi:hypothetical protein
LIAALAHLADAELGEESNVTRRIRLGHHQQGHLSTIAAGCMATGRDPRFNCGQTGNEFGQP